MKFRIHFSEDDYEDYLDIEGEDIASIRDAVVQELNKRNWNIDCCWSESLDDV